MSWKSLAEYHYSGKMRKAELVKKWRRVNEMLREQVDFWTALSGTWKSNCMSYLELYRKTDVKLTYANRKIAVWQLIALIFLGGFLYLITKSL